MNGMRRDELSLWRVCCIECGMSQNWNMCLNIVDMCGRRIS